ncbi:uncharacterized protein KY384_007643 [Bacidia gigantensis]|uniref:uncharacterized protein n=1 Tax=Bacidia gigantensis TaxID=2732470 RepID=UPI001D05BBA3|nr:uncharacterized protein KY384_007643 [Bacidia gigantensis]KAG8527491.1 hypothetical protein KY384_007643 [Bacidia gigantensis]
MLLPPLHLLILAAGSAQLCAGHTAFTNFFVDGQNQGDGVAVRMSNNPGHATFPIQGITSPEMACGVNGEKGVARVASTKAGSKITFEWRDYPDGSQPGAIDKSHKGSCAVYMKKVENAAADNNAAGDGWFKIMEYGQEPPDPQFYIGCAQIFLSSSGNSQPKDHVFIPGYVDLKTPAMTYNVWQEPLKPFTEPGPAVYTGSESASRLRTRAMQQDYGLKPANCVMQNANWCGFTPPTYTDQDGCWAASKNCSAQTQTCYTSAPPTGSKNCKNWDAYCTDIRSQCNAKNYQGPPSCGAHMPNKPGALTGGAVSAHDATTSATTQSADVGSTNGSTSSYSPQSSSTTDSLPKGYSGAPLVPVAMPVASGAGAVTASGNNSDGGSIDECGSRGGQTCKAGMCCSSHGYCGTTLEYCAANVMAEGAQGPDVQNLSSNWRRLQDTLSKNGSKRKRDAPEEVSHPIANGAKRQKSKGPRAKGASQQIQRNFQNLNMDKRASPLPAASASLALWAKDNQISPRDLAAAYGTSLQTTALPELSREQVRVNEGLARDIEVGRYLAIDCEMVGVGPNPDKESALARVSIVNYHGQQLYDSFVQTKETVTDYRTHVSGVTPKLLQTGRTLEQAQQDVASLIDGRILVGHALRNDLDALLLGHPKRDIRDTSKLSVFRQVSGGRTPSLKRLAKELLHMDIQGGEHSSTEDARATMLLFRREKASFEKEHMAKWGSAWTVGGSEAMNGTTTKRKSQKSKKRKAKK